jgi:hypothetical protein
MQRTNNAENRQIIRLSRFYIAKLNYFAASCDANTLIARLDSTLPGFWEF